MKRKVVIKFNDNHETKIDTYGDVEIDKDGSAIIDLTDPVYLTSRQAYDLQAECVRLGYGEYIDGKFKLKGEK